MIVELTVRVLSLVLLLVMARAAAGDPVGPAGEIAWTSWSPAIFDQARAEHRLVLLDLTADWCQFCKKMDATTYRDPEVMERIHRDYIAVRVDEKDLPDLAKRYTGRPTTVVFDAQGNEIMHKSGYLQPQWMVWLLEAVVAEPMATAHRN